MQTGKSIIIHKSSIIQQGLKSILLTRNIVIGDVMSSVPEYSVISNWKDILLFIDIQFADEFRKHLKTLKKNGNKIIGIETPGTISNLNSEFDDTLDINDNTETIIRKISDYTDRISDSKYNHQLSSREIELLTMVAQGYSNKQIAVQLFLSIHTVITHRKNITAKLGIKSISGLTLYAALNNMIDFHQ